MTIRRAPGLAGLAAGFALACASASSEPPLAEPARVVAPPAATEIVTPPPPDVVTICQRGANPTTGGDSAAVASFELFSRDWIAKMKAVTRARFATERKQVRDTYEMELRATGSTSAPWVGVLSYCEVTLQCAGAADTSCKPAASTVVKEVFRYEAGRWLY